MASSAAVNPTSPNIMTAGSRRRVTTVTIKPTIR